MKYSLKPLFVYFLLIAGISLIQGQSHLLISPENGFTYFSGTTEPPAGWMMPGFDDSLWESGEGLLGYGYGIEDALVDEEAASMYIRYRFHVEDASDFNEANFFADYDDAYIAYLNGKEIVRVNVDPSIENPGFDHLSSRSHAVQLYGWDDNYPVLGYYLDSVQLDSCVVTGENVIAVQVLNDSIQGSDLQFLLLLFDITHSSYNFYDWDSRYKDQVALDSTDFPLVIIETDEWGIPYSHIRRKAFMGIIDNGPEEFNHPADSCNVYYGDVSIEVRGQSSSQYPKRSYRFEFHDSLENDSNVAVLGMPADDDWILMGPFHDKAQFRNSMVFDMGTMLNGSYQPRTRYCELIMNGEYLGLYMMCETIKRNNDRVNIARLREDEIAGNDLTGGYIPVSYTHLRAHET